MEACLDSSILSPYARISYSFYCLGHYPASSKGMYDKCHEDTKKERESEREREREREREELRLSFAIDICCYTA